MSADLNLLESVRAQRTRLTAAMLFGPEGRERVRSSLLARLLVGTVLAAIAATACAGVGYVQSILEQRSEGERTVQEAAGQEGAGQEEREYAVVRMPGAHPGRGGGVP